MSLPTRARAAVLRQFSFTPENRHHGLQLAGAVLLAYFIPAAFGLREHLWAVMSVLIVMRPDTGGTLSAGWDRMRGTLAGALSGLLGSALQHIGNAPLTITLTIVALLAFLGALSPSLRSAPIAALIVLSAGALPGHTSLQAAELRVLQISMGVAIAAVTAMLTSRYRAAARVEAGCAELLRELSEQIRQPHKTEQAEQAERHAAATRRTLGKLALLATGADLETRLFRRGDKTKPPQYHQRMSKLVTRVVQDCGMLKRVTLHLAQHGERAAAKAAIAAASTAIASVAAMIAAGEGQPRLDALLALDHNHAGAADRPDGEPAAPVLLAAPVHLLREDLERLSQLLGKAPAPSPA